MLARGGVSLRVTDRVGAVLKHPSGKPRFEGLERGVINLVLTDRVPLDWDNGRRGGGGGDDFRGVLRVRDFDGGGTRESGAVFRGEYGGA